MGTRESALVRGWEKVMASEMRWLEKSCLFPLIYVKLTDKRSPSLSELAKMMGCSRMTVARAISALEDRGALRRRPTYLPTGGRGPNEYELLFLD